MEHQADGKRQNALIRIAIMCSVNSGSFRWKGRGQGLIIAGML
jgi:hypothetical protein